MGISLKEASILITAGIALIGIADNVFNIALGMSAGFPLPPCGETAATPAAQARLLDLGNHIIRRHMGKDISQGGIASDSDIVIDFRGINLTVSTENCPCLSLVEGNIMFMDDFLVRCWVDIKQTLDDIAI
ncbi:hypothetical protein ES703_43033 [subsurface metagenome]